MGIFDFLKKKDPVNDEKIPLVPNESIHLAPSSSQSLVPFFEYYTIYGVYSFRNNLFWQCVKILSNHLFYMGIICPQLT